MSVRLDVSRKILGRRGQSLFVNQKQVTHGTLPHAATIGLAGEEHDLMKFVVEILLYIDSVRTTGRRIMFLLAEHLTPHTVFLLP